MPNPFNFEKIRAEQQKREKKKAEREEVVWEAWGAHHCQ
jgi:hypothetical protein